MNQTTRVATEGFDAKIHHSHDWSGMAQLVWRDHHCESCRKFKSVDLDALRPQEHVHEAKIPGRLLVQFARAAALDWVKGGVDFALNDMREMPL